MLFPPALKPMYLCVWLPTEHRACCMFAFVF